MVSIMMVKTCLEYYPKIICNQRYAVLCVWLAEFILWWSAITEEEKSIFKIHFASIDIDCWNYLLFLAIL